jgi:hypothetical protein
MDPAIFRIIDPSDSTLAVSVDPGRCFRQSRVDPARPEARRCVLDNGIELDPCFDAGVKAPLCVKHPWFGGNYGNVVPIERIEEGPSVQVDRDAYWALELANGAYCLHLVEPTRTGATYGCDTGLRELSMGRMRGEVVGHPERSAGAWRVSYFGSEGHASRLVRVERAWR